MGCCMSKRGFLIVLLVLFNVLIFSCRSKKEVITEPAKTKELAAEYLFKQLKKNELKFKSFKAKINIEADFGDKQNTFTSQLRIQHDSLIWISIIPALGIEVARVMINQDSVFILNRISKTYFKGDFRLINNLLKIDVDYDILQSLLTGNDLAYYETNVFKANTTGKQYHLSTVGRSKLKKYVRTEEEDLRVLVQDIWLNVENFKIEKLSLKMIQKQNRKLEAIYKDFQDINGQLFSTTSDYQISSTEEVFKVNLKYSKITLDEKLNFPFSIPLKYTKMM